ncbi:MarR family winged helix-turn-helix transcriptional regulator [Agromyces neolithicus]|uniref:MarR family winged helix-turn-helix transcriptional regulator n=1 Tax=Agromyces neolithicus TaxID=269420 RepID=A0ABN2M069_9MICO
MSEVSAIDGSEWALWADYVLVHRELSRELDRRLMSDAGISQGDYTVMLTLFQAEDRRLRPGVLAEAIGWEKSRLSHQLTRMAARGLVERVDCDTDARGSLIVLTPDGRRALLGAMRDHASAIRTHFLDVLTADEKAAIASGSARLRERLRMHRDHDQREAAAS